MLPMYDLLLKSAKDNPGKAGFICRNKSYTFGDIEAAASGVARFLLSQGVAAGERIAILATKCIEEVIAIFAIMKIGGIFVDLNPHLKADQLALIISDCGARTLFATDSRMPIVKRSELAGAPLKRIVNLTPGSCFKRHPHHHCLEEILNARGTTGQSIIPIMENDPAAIIYTSGSTGHPKGIIVTHRILYDAARTSVQVLENNGNDRLISATPFCFDGALSQLFSVVYTGATLVLQDSGFPKDIVETMRSHSISGFHAVPSFWRMMLEKHSPLALYDYPHLRYLSIIGEPCPHALIDNLQAVLKHTRLFLMYGITEAFRSTVLYPDDLATKFPSIGKPLPGVQIQIVDEQDHPCGPGKIGEIVHSGAFVSPGYWNDPLRTARTFKKGALYTGDLGKYDMDGYLYFVGRKDSMFKSNGFQVYPEDIEACLLKMAGVHEAAVMTAASPDADHRIEAVLVCQNGSALTEKDVLRHCKQCLPYYMVPHSVRFAARIPKTSNFKIDRTQLGRRATRYEKA
jgi:amino acid adenylation domain-containing protein